MGSDAAVTQFPQKHAPACLPSTQQESLGRVFWGYFLGFFLARAGPKQEQREPRLQPMDSCHTGRASALSAQPLCMTNTNISTRQSPFCLQNCRVLDLSYLSKGGKWKKEREKTACEAKFVNELWFTNATADVSGGWWLGWLHLKIREVINSYNRWADTALALKEKKKKNTNQKEHNNQNKNTVTFLGLSLRRIYWI